MNNPFLTGLAVETNYKLTENGGVAHSSTLNDLYDMFAFGGAYRSRSEEDCIVLFKKALDENEEYAMKCLFYLRDCREGAGERRFFRICYRWLAQNRTEAARRNLALIPLYARWDDLYCLIGTPLENEMFTFLSTQLALDVQSNTPSLLAKWLPSLNAGSSETRKLALKSAKAFNLSYKQYRKTLSILRRRINVLETLMSEGRWDEIQYDKIPSKAGLIYRNAFARHDAERYKAFIESKETKVNAGTLYPYEVVEKAIDCSRYALDDTERLAVNKYWDNMTDYFKDKTFNGMAVVDTSGSMMGRPMAVAISLGLYCAERANGPFAGHYISFASRPQLIRTKGVDFCDKVHRIYQTNLCDNTNLEATFNLVLNTAIKHNCKQEDLPATLIVISDMEIDVQTGHYGKGNSFVAPMMENMRIKWEAAGYKMPKLVYWNVQARHDTILDAGPDVSYVSGCSPVLFEQIMTGKTGMDLMYDKLDSERYKAIH